MQPAVRSCARCLGATALGLLLSLALLFANFGDWSEVHVQKFRSTGHAPEGPPLVAAASSSSAPNGNGASAAQQQRTAAHPSASTAVSEKWPVSLSPWDPLPVEPLCKKYGWPVRSNEKRKPRIYYGLQASGQPDILELHIDEIYPVVHRISVIEVDRLNDGAKRDEHLNFSHPRFQRFADKVRAKNVKYDDVAAQAKKLTGMSWSYATERVQREFLKHGFQGPDGSMEPAAGDVIMVADGDEIPTREVLQALTDCDVTHFVASRKMIAAGQKPCSTKGGKVKVLMKTQVFQSYFDCPVKAPLWWHPDAVMAECILSGEWNMENIRTREGGIMTTPWSGRHMHNFYDDDGLAKKYKHYMHACDASHEASCNKSNFAEFRWRGCDPQAPDLGMYWWHTNKRPLNEFVDKRQGRMKLEEVPAGLASFALLEQKPATLEKYFWSTYGRFHNGPWVGEYLGKGSHDYLT